MPSSTPLIFTAVILTAHVALASAGSINWFACPDADGFQCAFYDVPMSYDPSHRLHTQNVSIALRKRPATDPNAPHVFLNYGGPGLSGTKFIIGRWSNETDFIPKQLDGLYNWVSFDPRGVNMTLPSTNCYQDSASAKADWSDWGDLGYGVDYRRQPSTANMSLAEYTTSVWGFTRMSSSSKALLRRRCQEYGNQDMLQSISTALTARDMKTLTEALGQDKLYYYGYSYGTVLGQTFAAMFPDSVGRMIIDGVWDADLYTNDMKKLTLAANVDYEDALDLLFQNCAAAGPMCALNNRTLTPLATMTVTAGDLRQRFENQLVALANKASAGFAQTLSPGKIVDVAIEASRYGVRSKKHLMSYLADLENNTGVPATYSKSSLHNNLTDNVFHRFADSDNEISLYNIHTIVCSDAKKFSLGVSEIAARMYNASKVNMYSESFSNFHNSACSDWPYEPTEVYRGPWEGSQLKTRTPVLVASSRLDPVTPLNQAQSVSKRLTGSSLVIVENGAHSADSGIKSQCYTDIVKSYLANATLPKYETSCKLDQPNPFLD